MRSKALRYRCVLMVLLCALRAQPKMARLTAAESFCVGTSQDVGLPVIEMTAKKYEFLPSVVRVKAGTKVLLKITAIDREHGFKINAIPEGSGSGGAPGLEFAWPEPRDGWKLDKGQETTVEFVAKRTGSYEFKCSLVCGFGHGQMKGQLIVEP
jgi:plastocyanin